MKSLFDALEDCRKCFIIQKMMFVKNSIIQTLFYSGDRLQMCATFKLRYHLLYPAKKVCTLINYTGISSCSSDNFYQLSIIYMWEYASIFIKTDLKADGTWGWLPINQSIQLGHIWANMYLLFRLYAIHVIDKGS